MKTTEKLQTRVVAWLGCRIIRAVGATLRWQVVGWDNLESVYRAGRRPILAFWHGRIFLASYYFRNRGIVVMTSRHRDGDYIAGVIQRLGYEAARGSSTRGGLGATREALAAARAGKAIGFAIDGPRGPRYVAKRGAAYVAWKSGCPMVPFNASAEKKWTLRSWDHFQIPRPFSRVRLEIGAPVYVDAATPKERLADYDAVLQNALDALRITEFSSELSASGLPGEEREP